LHNSGGAFAVGVLISKLSSGKLGKNYPENLAESPPSVWRINPVKKKSNYNRIHSIFFSTP
jgi:hypothetical protein